MDDNLVNRPHNDVVRLPDNNMVRLMDDNPVGRTHNDLVAILDNNASLRLVGNDRDALRGQGRGRFLHVGCRGGPRGRRRTAACSGWRGCRGKERLAMPIAVEVQPDETSPTPLKDHQRPGVVPAPQFADFIAVLVDDAEVVFLLRTRPAS